MLQSVDKLSHTFGDRQISKRKKQSSPSVGCYST